MGNIVTIALKELKSYFVSWMAYVVMGVYLAIAGFIFFEILMGTQQDVQIQWLFHNMSVTLLFVLPFITARLLAEEKSTGTLEILMTSPVTDTQLVLGKFLGAFSLFNVMLVLSCLFPLILGYYLKVFEMAGLKVVGLLIGPLVSLGLGVWFDLTDNELPDWLKWLVGFPCFFAQSLIICVFFFGKLMLWQAAAYGVASAAIAVLLLVMLALPKVHRNDTIRLSLAPLGLLLYNLAVPLVMNQGSGDMAAPIAAYIGLLLVGACFLAIGLLASSLTDNQFVAGVLGFGALLMLWIIGWAKDRMTGVWADVVSFVSVLVHFQDFPDGVIDTKDVIYFVSFVILCLFFAVRAVESRKWR
ncbi:MAG: hypothetical protein COZ06_27085 [Armatimonadetes bacterium CG_4_10_14_3_um_filter_66_18]|nr:ABC transporter permease subunit [Armatimonadota bacterium]OIP07143.1 MAG: hypothetical protein AUJ96_08110 [Armatimonadetes bacterium CG2_30_66_41]PIU93807.1 MAG: hypothetical protein COS65_10840 [Armatimonadetes bacterium CG06_land_8_20_14_3_00_66_21]PIX44232.1 MAG: hypothetical protein COZ57_17875 [Armatimonadetes bacterium CG_4_8_14_3_um_filter_66_20]PIY41125.1 MAG: hypothetical protein COZ06_27085 [Armatimonadetes bacterium CG_4_10_14_3_um_filter_66_18]PIZ34679.1 MAG: hypothetical prot